MNKYANQYLDTLKEKLLSYKPFNQSDAFGAAPEGAALGAIAGGGIGALSGLVSNPGYDEEGRKKSRIKASLKGLIGGGAIGAGAGALGTMALPTVARGLVDNNKKLELAALTADPRLKSNIPGVQDLQDLVNKGTVSTRAELLNAILSNSTIDQMSKYPEIARQARQSQ
jgi:hypothetical protein